MNFSEKLKELRLNKKMTQQQLADAIYVSRTLITKYETGAILPTRDNIEKIALLFNVKISELIDSDESTLILLEYAKSSLNGFKIFSIISIALNSIWILISFLPIFIHFKYRYPMLSGQDQPIKEYYNFSLVSGCINGGFSITIISLIVSMIEIVICILAIKTKNNKTKQTLNWASIIGFILCMFLMFFGFLFGFIGGTMGDY